MPLDALCLTAVLEELRPQILGSRVDKVQQPEKDKIILTLRGHGGAGGKLLLGAGTGRARLHLTAQSYENPQSPPMFCMLLRKHLSGGRLVEIHQPPAERIVRLLFDITDSMGEPSRRELVLELMGKYCNLILVDQEGIILEAMRRIEGDVSQDRCILPGLYYRLPDNQGKCNPLALNREDFARHLEEVSPDTRVDKWLLDRFLGLSPLICRELAVRGFGEGEARFSHGDSQGFLDLLTAFFADIRGGAFAPYQLFEGSIPVDFSYTPIYQYGASLTMVREESFSALLDGFYEKRDGEIRLRQRAGALIKTVTNLRDKTARKIQLQKKEKAEAEDREHLREKGDIVTANIHGIGRGQTLLKALNFYDPDGGETEIPLDPRKSPSQNAGAYYKRYTKAKTAERHLTEQIQKGEGELAYLNSVLEAAGRAETAGDVEQIRRELADGGLIRVSGGEKRRKALPGGPMAFQSSAGIAIYAGKNNTQNDQLTFQRARRGDMWLHTQKIHGSHVIIALDGAVLDDVTLEEAAVIAAWYSQGRNGTKIPVDYTLVKHVKKPAGGRPGAAHYVEYKTIYVNPDEALVNRLRKGK